MGSYDTGECYIPRTITPPSTPPRRMADPPVPASTTSEETTQQTSYSPSSDYDPQLKTIVALGGGLTPDRIVQPIPDEVRDGDLTGVVKYLTGDSVATRPEDRTIVEAVQERMREPDYRVIINDRLNYHNEKMGTPLTTYLMQKTQAGEDGEFKYNFADISIVTHEEGGLPLERRL